MLWKELPKLYVTDTRKHRGSWVWVFLRLFVSFKLIFIVPFNFYSISIYFFNSRGRVPLAGNSLRAKKSHWQIQKVTLAEPKSHTRAKMSHWSVMIFIKTLDRDILVFRAVHEAWIFDMQMFHNSWWLQYKSEFHPLFQGISIICIAQTTNLFLSIVWRCHLCPQEKVSMVFILLFLNINWFYCWCCSLTAFFSPIFISLLDIFIKQNY